MATAISKAALFLVARREKTAIFLEPNGADQVQTVIDTIAGLMGKNPDDVTLYFQNSKLAVDKTLEECHISAQGEAIVEAIEVNFVYKVEGTDDDWEEVTIVPYAASGPPHDEPTTAGTTAEGGEEKAP